MQGQAITVRAHDGGAFQCYVAQPPRGSGPGIVLCQEIFGVNRLLRDVADLLAQEGYVVVVPDLFWRMEPGLDLGYSHAEIDKAMALNQRFDQAEALRDIESTVAALRAHPACKGKVAAVGFCLGGRLAVMTAAGGHIDCAVSYYGVNVDRVLTELPPITIPMVLHFADDDALVSPQARLAIKQHFHGRDDVEIYGYPGVGHGFVNPVRPAYHKPSADMAYTRTLALLRKVMGPHYDLSALWEVHRSHEFVTRDADETMKTMVDEPYVNHIPTLTGGHGQRELHRFYKHHFIPRSPKDMRNIPISRTIGVDRIVNEGVLCFTHDIEIDWMLPGLKPTGRYVEVPLVGVVTFRGDKLVHEHIYWDQASVLVQLGLLDPTGLPVAGIASAKKVLDPRLPANELMPNWSDSGPTA